MHRNRPIQKYVPQEYFLFLLRRSTLIFVVHIFQAVESVFFLIVLMCANNSLVADFLSIEQISGRALAYTLYCVY